ncbi:hypothetical protein CRYUN_Cryun08bG0112700 [Craigia yunnanensis]
MWHRWRSHSLSLHYMGPYCSQEMHFIATHHQDNATLPSDFSRLFSSKKSIGRMGMQNLSRRNE